MTRSGSNGRVVYIGKQLTNAIVSDDMIRVRIPDEKTRMFVLSFLQTHFAQDQMARNEYGSVQQHLEPIHLRELLVPIPEDWTAAESIIQDALDTIVLRAQLSDLVLETRDAVVKLIKEVSVA